MIPAGVGGTQKAAWLFAEGLARRGHEVKVFSGSSPYHDPDHPVPGLKVEPIHTEADSFPAIRDGRFDALHLHVPGYSLLHPIYPLLHEMGKNRPKVVETNILGWLTDRAAHGVTDQHLFVSMTSACQAARRSWKSLRNLKNCGVARNPICPPRPFTREARSLLRSRLGFTEQDIVALRLGRPDPAKWTAWECCAVKAARQNGSPHIKLLAIEPSPQLKAEISSGTYGEGIVSLPLVTDPSQVEALIDASDVILHAARYGESYGYALAEGMAASKPVISRSTPWGDNAQVELVDHGKTGFICCTLEGFTEALQIVANDEALRSKLGREGKARILDLADLDRECALLDAAFSEPGSPLLQERWENTLAFGKTLHAREWNVFEATHGPAVGLDRNIFRRERIYSRIREGKAVLSAARASLRSAMGATAYR